MIFELERTHRVRDLFERIGLPVRIVVHRVDAPLVTRPMMLGVQNAVHHRIAHVQIGRSHINLRPQNA